MSPEKRGAEMMRAQEAANANSANANSALVEGFEIVVATRMSVPLFAHPPVPGVACARLTLSNLAKQASINK